MSDPEDSSAAADETLCPGCRRLRPLSGFRPVNAIIGLALHWSMPGIREEVRRLYCRDCARSQTRCAVFLLVISLIALVFTFTALIGLVSG